MQNCYLPIELCELIIDLIPKGHLWWEGYGAYEPSSYRVKFTSICSAWLPRARLILYYTPVLVEPRQVELFVHSITRDPSLADMVHELVVDPRDPSIYIPFVRDTLVKRVRNLKTLVLGFQSQMTWVYPPRQHLLVSRYPLTELAIHYQHFCSSYRPAWFETFRLIWSLRYLRKLHLDMQSDSAPDLTDEDVRRLTAIRRPWTCANLRTLVLDGWDYHDVLPERAFGTSVQQLSFHVYGNPISKSGAFLAQLGEFSALQQLYIWIKAGNGKPGDDNSAASLYIAPILTHLPPQETLASVTIRLDDAGGQKTRREEFLQELYWHTLDDLLTRKFSRLTAVRFHLPERFDSAYGAEWWQGLLDEYLPKLRGIASVSVQTYHHGDWRAEHLCWTEHPDAYSPEEDYSSENRSENESDGGDCSDQIYGTDEYEDEDAPASQYTYINTAPRDIDVNDYS